MGSSSPFDRKLAFTVVTAVFCGQLLTIWSAVHWFEKQDQKNLRRQQAENNRR